MTTAEKSSHTPAIGLRVLDDPNQPNRKIVFCGKTVAGHIYETDRKPSMRFKWISANDRYDYAATVAECLVRIASKVPGVIAEMEREAARRAAFDAQPEHIQALILAKDKAQREYDRENHRVPVREDDLARAAANLSATSAALEAALSPVARTLEAA